jgi:hypothetical protein
MTITGLAVTDIEIYKNGSTTQRASDAGYTLLDTDGIDFDGVTGIHGISVNTSDDTTGGFFVAGADYWVVISSITLDAATINFAAAVFSIENRRAAGELVSTTIATLASQTSFTLTAGSADDDAYNNCTAIVKDKASAIQKAVGLISDYTGASKTITLAADPGIFTMAVGDNVSIIATSALANVRSVNGTLQTANDNSADINDILTDTGTTIPGTISTAQADLDTLTGADGATLATSQSNYAPATAAALTTHDGKLDTADTVVDAIKAVTDLLPDAGALNDLATILADTNELQGDWTNTGRLDTIIDAIKAVTDNLPDAGALNDLAAILTDTAVIGALGAGLTNIPWNASWDAEVQSEVQDAIEANHLDHLFAAAYDPASKPGAADALLNELVENDGGVARYTTNALEQAPSAGTNPNVLVDTTIAVVTDQTHFTLTAGSNDDDAYNDQAVVMYDASDSDYPSVRIVDDYTGATKTVTLDSAPDFTILAGDGIKIFVTAPGTVAPTAAAIVNEWETQSQADPTGFHVNVLEVNGTAQTANDNSADINEILTDTGTTIPGTISTAQADLDTLTGADGATLATSQPNYAPATAGALTTHDGKLDTADTVVDAIKAVTDALPDSGALNDLATLASRLSAARAGYLDELGAANIPADIDTLLGRVTAAVALASVCTEGRMSELDAANIPANVDTLLSRVSAVRAGYLDELAAANIPADVDTLLTRITASNAGSGEYSSSGCHEY